MQWMLDDLSQVLLDPRDVAPFVKAFDAYWSTLQTAA